MKVAIIHGSAREDGNNAHAIALVKDELMKYQNLEVIEIHPAKMKLDMPNLGPSMDKARLQQLVKDADGVILNTPEYHGSYSSLIKMTIENLGFPSALSKKPVSLFGVAGGAIGAVKSLEHLSSVCHHTGAIVLPKYVSVANGNQVFSRSGECKDAKVEQRLRKMAQELVRFILDIAHPDKSFEQVVREDAI